MWIHTLRKRLERNGYTVITVEDNGSGTGVKLHLAGKHVVVAFNDGRLEAPNGDERLKGTLERICKPEDRPRPLREPQHRGGYGGGERRYGNQVSERR